METLETPVLLLAFNRPELTSQVWKQIRQAKPRQLFIALDGPRRRNWGDYIRCAQVRRIVNRVDWPCEVKQLRRRNNLGCKRAVSGAISWFFEQVEAGIILEDDCVPNQIFFGFCQDLLRLYALDERVMHINGSNFLFGQKVGEASYFFGKLADVWGWATWRRAWRHFDSKMPGFAEFKLSDQLEKYLPDKALADWLMTYLVEAYEQSEKREGIWSSAWQYAMVRQRGLAAVPQVNLVSNIGMGTMATNARDASWYRVAEMPQQDLGKLTHPPEIVAGKAADLLRWKIIQETDPRVNLRHAGIV